MIVKPLLLRDVAVWWFPLVLGTELLDWEGGEEGDGGADRGGGSRGVRGCCGGDDDPCSLSSLSESRGLCRFREAFPAVLVIVLCIS